MPVLYQQITQCCGCGACGDICPKSAISMEMKEGFLYPVIDPERCVECGLCVKVCAFNRGKNTQSNSLNAFACKNKDAQVRLNSSSGGVFTAVSDWVLAQQGVIYGAAYDEGLRVAHHRTQNGSDRNRMRGSKYVQSDTSGIFRQVKEDLQQGRRVLFTGTGCQVAALKAFLGKEYDNLILIDIICHGVPSPEVWARFVAYIREKYGKVPTDFAFRNKEVSWRSYSPKLSFVDGSEVGQNDHTGSFIELFRYDLCLRPSCTVCRYTSMHREGDLTIGDFWGIENVLPEIDDGKGVSALLVNSAKGQRLVGQLTDVLELKPCTPEQIAGRQPNLSRPSQHSTKAAAFAVDLQAMPFDQVLKKYTRVGVKRRLIDGIKKILHRI